MTPSSRRNRRRGWIAIAFGSTLAIGVASANANRGDYIARSFVEAANPGLAVTEPLEEFRAVSGARVIVPTAWKRLGAGGAQLRFITPGRICRYRVTFTLRTRLAAPGDGAAYATNALPSAGPAYLLDAGQRGNSAFRVVRQGTTGSVVRVDALRAGVLTRRSDIVPTGQVAWTELRVTASSRRGDECHSGTYREVLGPQVGDALATARTRLRFVRQQR
jgi:hypothetical protein